MITVPQIDARFVDIGDLPTGFSPYDFKRLYVREFSIAELKLIYLGMHSRVRPVEHLLRAVQLCCSVPVMQLTDGDLEFVMAWLRMHSYPKAPMQVSWTCTATNVVKKVGRDFWRGPPMTQREMDLKGYEYEVCNTKNVSIVQKYGTNILTLDDNDLVIRYDDIDFPRCATLPDFFEMVEEEPHKRHMLECARWVKKFDSLKAKYAYLTTRQDMDLYERIAECRDRYHHGIEEKMHLKCRVCDYEWTHHTTPRILSFFADNTEEDLFKIQYNLLSEFGQQYDPDMPAKLLLFNFSSLAKDRKDAAERKKGFTPLG